MIDEIPGFLKDGTNAIMIGNNGEVKTVHSSEDKIKKHARRNGSTFIPTNTIKNKKGRPKRVQGGLGGIQYMQVKDDPEPTSMPPEYVVTTTSVKPPVIKERVFFENNFGRIKLMVEKVLYKDLAIALMFESEDDVIFEPKTGEVLTLITPTGKFDVLYPGTLFDLPFEDKQLMVLYKSTGITTEPEEVNKQVDFKEIGDNLDGYYGEDR